MPDLSDMHLPGHDRPELKKTPGKAAASGWVGCALEYYDFFLYASAAALVFPQVFFPKGNDAVAIIGSLATFGVGYVARPVGAFFMGHFGDTIGRKKVLVICMMMMGLSTFLVGCLPSYDTIGLWAPAALVFLRLLQGFAVSGELAGAAAMTLEHAPLGKRGFYGSFNLQGTQAGQILAAALFIPLSAWLPDDKFTSWGWRIPFLLSALVVLAAYIIRSRVDETPAFQEEILENEVPRAPIPTAFAQSKANMARVMIMCFVNAVAVTTTVFGAAYATQDGYGLKMDKTTFLWIPVAGNIAAVLIIPFVGRLSDKIGRRPVYITGTLLSGALVFPYLVAIQHKNDLAALVMAVVMWGVFYQGYNAVYPSFFLELFPTKTRVTATAIATQVGFGFTGFIPTLESWIAPPGTNRSVPLTVGLFVFGFTILAAIAAYTVREPFRIPLDQLGKRDAQPLSKEEYEQARSQPVSV